MAFLSMTNQSVYRSRFLDTFFRRLDIERLMILWLMLLRDGLNILKRTSLITDGLLLRMFIRLRRRSRDGIDLMTIESVRSIDEDLRITTDNRHYPPPAVLSPASVQTAPSVPQRTPLYLPAQATEPEVLYQTVIVTRHLPSTAAPALSMPTIYPHPVIATAIPPAAADAVGTKSIDTLQAPSQSLRLKQLHEFCPVEMLIVDQA
jgi:hypothetical protein